VSSGLVRVERVGNGEGSVEIWAGLESVYFLGKGKIGFCLTRQTAVKSYCTVVLVELAFWSVSVLGEVV
jgi:hypothetical protein